jgi:pyruvate kinase
MLDAVIREAESLPPVVAASGTGPDVPAIDADGSRHGLALAHAAVTLATTGQADAIVAVTAEGRTARLLSACRPAAPILAMTPGREAAGAMSVLWGVEPIVIDVTDIDRLTTELVDMRLLAADAVVVFINVSPDQSRSDANFLHVRRISAPGTP